MREMKDSGIEWIGEIPKDWSLKKGRYLFVQRNDRGNDENLQLLSPSQKFGVIPQSLLEDLTTQTTVKLKENTDLSTLKTVHKGDFCISLRSFQGGFEYSEYEGVVSPAYQIFYKKEDLVNTYYKYIFKDSSFISKMNSYTMSLRDGKNISYFDFGNTYLPLPTVCEQQQIADYLDTQCSEIDATAEDIQKEISLLEDYKKSLITEAVTKGLNPHAEMKDSGVKWIGKIPINWQAVNPRWLFAQRKDRAKKGMEQYTASQKYGVISQKDYMNRIGGSIVTVQKDFDILKMVCEGDFVIHMRSFQGGLEYSEHTGSISSAYVMLIPQKNTGECRYFKWLFKSASYINALQSTSNLIRDGQAMRYSNFIQIIIPYPPLEEQQQIADFLDAIIADKKHQRGILVDYKKSLIYECVTGKQEVPVHE